MKGNISRSSFRQRANYSGVFQVQGGMVTDADLGEQATIARTRTDLLGHDTAGSGVPEEGGLVRITGGAARLRPGVVFAEGVRGVVQSSGALNGPLALYGKQAHFPDPPEMPGTGSFLIYADVWERTVTLLEDELIADPGFHGAETALRQQTVAQVKFANVSAEDLMRENGPIPRIGNGKLQARAVDAETIADECDPCAETVSATQTMANGLFRIEVVRVDEASDDPGKPKSFSIAWSAENAAAIAKREKDMDHFSRAGAVYEAFSPETEMMMGYHYDQASIRTSKFISAVDEEPAADPNAPGGQKLKFLRRWDGMATITRSTGQVKKLGTGDVTYAGSRLTLSTGVLEAVIDFDEGPILAGDYWLIETRKFSEQTVRVVSETPVGIRHHYCPLFRVVDGDVQPLEDAEARRLSFPTLADIPATHVSFNEKCPDFFNGAENVQEALDVLCDLDASKIPFDPDNCSRLYDSADNVQDALDNLCKVDFGFDRYLRLMHDWGVVCGVIPRRKDRHTVSWTGGAILDRMGHLADVKAGQLKLAEIAGTERFHFDNMDDFDGRFRKGGVCLALAIAEGGKIEVHIVPSEKAFGKSDPTFLSVFNSCRQQLTIYDFKEDLKILTEGKRKVVDKVLYAAGSKKLGGSQKLTGTEGKVAREYTKDLRTRYEAHVSDDAEAKATLKRKIEAAEKKIRPQDAAGEVQDNLILQLEAAKYEAIRETEKERILRCRCDAMMPRCPEPGEAPYLVPIACLRGFIEGGDFVLEEVCPHCCRKQALSWRMVQYYTAEFRRGIELGFARKCCPEKKEEDDPELDIPPDIIIPDREYRIPEIQWPPRHVPDPWVDPKWDPSKVFRGVEESLGRIGGWQPPDDYRVRPDIADLGIDVATTALDGNGIKVTETIEIDDPGAIDRLREASNRVDPDDLVLDDGSLSPGDEVALIVRDGIAVDYIKLDTGRGKALFEKSAPRMDGGELKLDLGERARSILEDYDAEFLEREKAAEDARKKFADDLAAREKLFADKEAELAGRLAERSGELETFERDFTERLKMRREEIEATEATLGELRESKSVIAAEIAATGDDIARLREEREAVLRNISSAREELSSVREARGELLGEIENSLARVNELKELHAETLRDVETARTTMKEAMRREMPITAVTGDNTRFAAVLANEGIVSAGEFAELSDARLKALATRSNTNLNTARALKRNAGTMIRG